MHLVTTWFGSFLVDEGRVVERRLFPKDPEALADRLPPPRGLRVRPRPPPLGDDLPGPPPDAQGGHPGRPPPPGRRRAGRPAGDGEPPPRAAAGVVRPPLPRAREDRGRPRVRLPDRGARLPGGDAPRREGDELAVVHGLDRK